MPDRSGSGRRDGPDLPDLCAAAMAEAAGDEAVEVFAEEGTRVQVRARAGEEQPTGGRAAQHD